MKKTVSRQRLHQIKLKELGRCGLCGKDLHPILKSCIPCADKANQRLRAKKGYKPKVAGGPGRPRKILDETGTKATTETELKMSKATYSLSNRALAQDLGVSQNTVAKYRRIYGHQSDRKAVTDLGMMMSVVDYSMSDKEIMFRMNVSQPTVTKYRKLYAPNTKS
jgi:DNA-binding CsgD family transcriptional regulator